MTDQNQTSADVAFTTNSTLYANRVGPFIPPGQPFALLDFPNHFNVGDSAIWSGELAFLDKHVGHPASYVGTLNHDPVEVADFVPDGPVLIHGGGNFGDVWSNHQTFRHRVLEVMKGRQVVQLPQSVHFFDSKARDETARAIAAHGQFVLMVRDRQSRDLAREQFDCEVIEVPDAAVNLFHLPAPAATDDIISVLRTDREAVWKEAVPFLQDCGAIIDWPAPNVWSLPDRIRKKILEATTLTGRMMMVHREAMYRRQAEMRIDAGVQSLSRAHLIVSDRLHVHLMAALMRRPHIVLDNVYGKIGRHIAAWGDFGLARRVETPTELEGALS